LILISTEAYLLATATAALKKQQQESDGDGGMMILAVPAFDAVSMNIGSTSVISTRFPARPTPPFDSTVLTRGTVGSSPEVESIQQWSMHKESHVPAVVVACGGRRQ
jgi:hypothetical protein